MKYNAAIVEDDEKQAQQLASYLERYGNENGCSFSVTFFRNALDFLSEYACDMDMIFMDIQMPMMDGMMASKKLRERDARVRLIFVTSMAQYALGGYAVNAIDFCVKPVRYEDLAFTLKRVILSLGQEEPKKVALSFHDRYRLVDAGDILYVEVAAHTLTYHLKGGETVNVRGTMSAVEKELADAHFMRCNKCYLVNPRWIDEVQGYSLRIGNEELAISRLRRKEFMKELGEWLSRDGR